MSSKLIEMDQVVNDIYTRLLAGQDGRRAGLFVLGDHGMTDAGNHGGASPEETDTACLFAFVPPFDVLAGDKGPERINQLDIAPSISLLFGLSPPRNSIGRAITKLFLSLKPRQLANGLLKNLVQIRRLAPESSLVSQPIDSFERMCGTEETCQAWIMAADAAMGKVSSMLSGSHSGSFESTALIAAILLSLLCLCATCFGESSRPITALPLTLTTFGVGLVLVAPEGYKALGLGVLGLALLSTRDTVGRKPSLRTGLLLSAYLLSVFASSFIEEEHELWNHLIPLLLATNPHSSPLEKLMGLVLARLLRGYNANGYEYRAAPDIKTFMDAHPWAQGLGLYASLALSTMSSGGPLKMLQSALWSYTIVLYKWEPGSILHARLNYLQALLGLVTGNSATIGLFLTFANKPHNAMALVLLRYVHALTESDTLSTIAVLHYSYFALGPSNLITSIDLSNSYIGLGDYNPAIVGLLTFAILFSGPLQAATYSRRDMDVRGVVAFRTAVQLFVMLCCFVQRHHISVWTVFTPRLLFELLWTLFYVLLLPIAMLIGVWTGASPAGLLSTKLLSTRLLSARLLSTKLLSTRLLSTRLPGRKEK